MYQVQNLFGKILVNKIYELIQVSKKKLWFLCTALLLNEIFLPMKFQVSILEYFLSYAPNKIKKWTKGNNSKSMKL